MLQPAGDLCVGCRLEILYLGGNRLTCLPTELGRVTSLVSLVVSDNELSALPRSLTNLSRLQSLSLHNNVLVTLPPDIIRLPLVELSLRNNPFVVKFVEELTYAAPSLLELSGRAVKLNHITYSTDNIPASLVTYLDSAQSCVNPRCNGIIRLGLLLAVLRGEAESCDHTAVCLSVCLSVTRCVCEQINSRFTNASSDIDQTWQSWTRGDPARPGL